MIDYVLDKAFSIAQSGANLWSAGLKERESVVQRDSSSASSISEIPSSDSTIAGIKTTVGSILKTASADSTIAEIKTKVESILKTASDALYNHSLVDHVSNACITLSKKLISHSTLLKQESSAPSFSVNASIIKLLDHVSPLLIKLSEKLDLLSHQDSHQGEMAANSVRSIIDHIRLPFTTPSSSASVNSVFSTTHIITALNPLTWADYFLFLIASVDNSHGISAFLQSSGVIHLVLSAYHGVFFFLAAFGFLSMFRSFDKSISGSRFEGFFLLFCSMLEAVFWRYEQQLEKIEVSKVGNDVKKKRFTSRHINENEQPGHSIKGPLHKPYFNSIPADDERKTQ